MTTTLNPYLAFEGTCEEAMKFYAEALNGKLEIMRFGDSPMPAPPGAETRVMHAKLTTDSLVFMASDGTPEMKIPAGKNVSLSLNFTDPAEQDRVWARLSAGAKIDQPLGDMFWGRWGALTDRFGVQWMLNHEAAKK